jgi:hypothetical protein
MQILRVEWSRREIEIDCYYLFSLPQKTKLLKISAVHTLTSTQRDQILFEVAFLFLKPNFFQVSNVYVTLSSYFFDRPAAQ